MHFALLSDLKDFNGTVI